MHLIHVLVLGKSFALKPLARILAPTFEQPVILALDHVTVCSKEGLTSAFSVYAIFQTDLSVPSIRLITYHGGASTSVAG